MDDRLLTKRVRNYYEIIEKLIFYEYKTIIANHKLKNESFDDSERVKIIEVLKKNRIDKYFYSDILVQNYSECGKFLGLFSNNKTHFHVNFYINGEKYILHKRGYFEKHSFKEGEFFRPDLFGAFPGHIIPENGVKIIDKFLENLRKYWKHNYTRRKYFRGNLNQKLDFSDILKINFRQ